MTTTGIESILPIASSDKRWKFAVRVILEDVLSLDAKERLRRKMAIDTVAIFGNSNTIWVQEGRDDYYFATQSSATTFSQRWLIKN